MIINKKMLERLCSAKNEVFIFISNTNNESKNFLGSIDQLPSPLSTWRLVITERKNENR